MPTVSITNVSMALDQVENAIDGARARFEHAGESAVLGLAKQLAGSRSKRPPKAPQELVDALHGEMTSLYTTGRSSVRHELNAQRPGTSPDNPISLAQNQDSLLQRAVLAANSITQAIWQVIQRLGMSDTVTAAQRQRAGEAEGRARLRADGSSVT